MRLWPTLLSISAMQVLLVEDDEGVASALAELLGHAGAAVIRTGRGADALHRVKGCDLVLLDLGLPDMDGLDVLRTLRRASAVPVIIMTARDSDGAVVLGLRAGADDYLVKPVRKAVLLARIDAVMRRVRRVGGDPSASSGPVVAGPVTIDQERREVTVAGTRQPLTKTEFQILHRADQGQARRTSAPDGPRVRFSAGRLTWAYEFVSSSSSSCFWRWRHSQSPLR
jgi:DNA-binding response OmpR family regulator